MAERTAHSSNWRGEENLGTGGAGEVGLVMGRRSSSVSDCFVLPVK